MIGVTIGVGQEWNQIATWAANRMEQNTGLECHVVSECPKEVAHCSWLKCRVCDLFPQEDSFLVFDADIVCQKHWQPEEIFEKLGRPFCVVPDRNWRATFVECKQFSFPWPDWYVNAGLIIFGREHQTIWDSVWSKHPQYGSWLEQTALNNALLNYGGEVCRLPRRFNRLLAGINPVAKSEAVNLHAAGIPNRSIEMLQTLFNQTYAKRHTPRLAPEPAQELSMR